ncbi:MAG: Holliday junction branch migration protein RuvA [Candidatus Aminicenantes bacterium]|nr:Holliday junction branch migration protein RuvA [Candidatus Aminicenantes bacterium]
MISYLKGVIKDKNLEEVTLDINGVGYCTGVPLSTYLELGEEGDEVELHVYTHVTDSCISLYGFLTPREKKLFLKLINISGIGPKIALNILSGIGVSDLEQAIKKSDIDRLSLVPGIGKKTAMRIALELQGKFKNADKILTAELSKEKEDLLSALTNMGFKRKEVYETVDQAVKKMGKEAGFDKLLKESLKHLSKL